MSPETGVLTHDLTEVGANPTEQGRSKELLALLFICHCFTVHQCLTYNTSGSSQGSRED